MSDQIPGDDWWTASDGEQYPPHLHPDYQPPADAPPPPRACEFCKSPLPAGATVCAGCGAHEQTRRGKATWYPKGESGRLGAKTVMACAVIGLGLAFAWWGLYGKPSAETSYEDGRRQAQECIERINAGLDCD